MIPLKVIYLLGPTMDTEEGIMDNLLKAALLEVIWICTYLGTWQVLRNFRLHVKIGCISR